jgi:hypothetical protein
MFHPLLGDLSKLKDTDVEAKVLDLSKKYGIAMRLGQGSAAQQICIALDSYRSELMQRQQASIKSTMTKGNKDLDDLINVD